MISNRVQKLYQRADRMSAKRLNVLRDAIRTFTVTRANQAAASLAWDRTLAFLKGKPEPK